MTRCSTSQGGSKAEAATAKTAEEEAAHSGGEAARKAEEERLAIEAAKAAKKAEEEASSSKRGQQPQRHDCRQHGVRRLRFVAASPLAGSPTLPSTDQQARQHRLGLQVSCCHTAQQARHSNFALTCPNDHGDNHGRGACTIKPSSKAPWLWAVRCAHSCEEAVGQLPLAQPRQCGTAPSLGPPAVSSGRAAQERAQVRYA